MSEQPTSNQDVAITAYESPIVSTETSNAHDSDDEPMVYVTPRDYKSWAIQEKARLLAEGAEPDTVILQSEVKNYVGPRGEDEAAADFTKRYCNTMNDMIRRGVQILNDRCTADQVASGFQMADGRFFDLGPKSGATKGEFREFGEWFDKVSNGERGQKLEVPEKFLKWEKPPPTREGNA